MSEYMDVPALVERARAIYVDEERPTSPQFIEIDDDARVSVTDNGVWVQAWVWVPDR